MIGEIYLDEKAENISAQTKTCVTDKVCCEEANEVEQSSNHEM